MILPELKEWKGRVEVRKEEGEDTEKLSLTASILDHSQSQSQLYLVYYGGMKKKTETWYLHLISSRLNKFSIKPMTLIIVVFNSVSMSEYSKQKLALSACLTDFKPLLCSPHIYSKKELLKQDKHKYLSNAITIWLVFTNMQTFDSRIYQ